MGCDNKGKAVKVISSSELTEILSIIANGCSGARKHRTVENSKIVGIRGNKRVALALLLQAQTGLMITVVLKLTLEDFSRVEDGWVINVKENCRYNSRKVYVQDDIVNQIVLYATATGKQDKDILFNITPRTVQKYIAIATDYLGIENVSTGSFRKYYANMVFEQCGGDIDFVRRAFNHTTPIHTKEWARL